MYSYGDESNPRQQKARSHDIDREAKEGDVIQQDHNRPRAGPRMGTTHNCGRFSKGRSQRRWGPVDGKA